MNTVVILLDMNSLINYFSEDYKKRRQMSENEKGILKTNKVKENKL